MKDCDRDKLPRVWYVDTNGNVYMPKIDCTPKWRRALTNCSISLRPGRRILPVVRKDGGGNTGHWRCVPYTEGRYTNTGASSFG
jgi:hypothetical protein